MKWKVLLILVPFSLLLLLAGVWVIRHAERLAWMNRKLASFGLTGGAWPSNKQERPISALEKVLPMMAGLVLAAMGGGLLLVALADAIR